METVCIYIEKYYFEEKFFPYIKNFLNDLKEDFFVYIFIPDIFIIKNVIKNPSIYKYLHKLKFKIEKIEPLFEVDALIIFSDYDKGMYFDRRELIVNAINSRSLFAINTNNFKNIIPISNIKPIMLLNEVNFMNRNEMVVENIFTTYNFNMLKKRDAFFEKYKLKKDRKVIGILSKKLDISMNDLSKEFNLVSVSLESNFITKVKIIDFIYIISYSDKFISDYENFIFLNNITSKNIKVIFNKNRVIKRKNMKSSLPSIKFCIKNILQNKKDIKNNYYINKKDAN